jgi:SulP family sulfate permease
MSVLGRDPATGSYVDRDRDPASRPVPGIVVLRPESGLFFANAETLRQRVRAAVAEADSKPQAVVLDAETVPYIDLTAVRMLDALADDLERDGVHLAIARDVGQVRDLMGATARSADTRRNYPTVNDAVAALAPPDDHL